MNERTPQQPKENKMGTMPVGKLLITMALPIMVSMLVQALYNIVDSMYVAQINENALTAVSLAFPVQNLMIGVATGTGVGMNALLSKSLGEKNFREVNSAAANGTFLLLCSSLLFALVGGLASRLFYQVQTDDAQILRYGTEYLTIITVGSFGLFGQILFERLLQSTGRTMYCMVTQGIGALLNILLDPVLIFGWFGLPAMGVAGAAVATVFSQIVAMLIGLYLNQKKNPEVQLQARGFRPGGATIRRIYSVGVPSMFMVTVGSVMTFGMNQILISFTTTATAVFGVYFKLQSFVFMPVMGLNNGMVPILSYNYGARNRERMIQAIRLSIFYATAIMAAGMLVFLLVPRQLLGLFNPSPEMLQIGEVALRRIGVSFSLAGFCIVCGSVFQALGKGLLSLIASVGRQLVVLLPSAYLLSRLGNLDLVWFAYPIAEVVSVLLSGLFLIRVYRTVIRPIEPKEPAWEDAVVEGDKGVQSPLL